MLSVLAGWWASATPPSVSDGGTAQPLVMCVHVQVCVLLFVQLENGLQRKGQALLEAQEALERERERLSAVEEDHQCQLASLSDELTGKTSEYEELVNALKRDLGNLGRENLALENKCSTLQKQVEEQRCKLTEHEQNFKEMTDQISHWMKESQAGHSQAERDTVERLHQAMESLRQEQVLHNWTKESFAEERLSLQSQCRELTAACAELQSKTDQLMAEAGQLKEQLQFVSQDKMEAEKQHTAEVKRLQALVDAATILQTENDELIQKFEFLSDQLATAHRQLAEVDRHSVETHALQEEVDRVQSDLVAAKTHAEELQRQFAALEGEMDALRQLKEDEVGSLNSRVSELEELVEAREGELSLSQRENVELKQSLGEKLRQAAVERDHLRGELAELKERMAASDVLHQKQLMDERSSFAADLTGHRAELQRERKHLEEEITQANADLEETRSRLEWAEGARDECAAQLSAMKAQLDEVSSKMAGLSKQHEVEVSQLTQKQGHLQQEWGIERRSLQEHITLLQTDLEGARRQVCELESQLAEGTALTERERVFAEKVASLQEEIDKLMSTIEHKQAELVELQSMMEEVREKKDAALQEVGEQLSRAREARRESELRLASSEQQRESREAELRQQLADVEASFSDQVKNMEGMFSEKIATLEKDLMDTKKQLSEKSRAMCELEQSAGEKEKEWHQTMDVLGRQVDQLTVEVKEQYSYVAQLRATLAEQAAEKEMIQAELDRLQLAVGAGGSDAQQDEIDHLKQHLAEVTEELRKKQSMLHSMELSLDVKEDLLSESCDSMSSLRSQVEELQGRLTPEPLDLDSTDGTGQWVSTEVRRLSAELQRERRRSVDLQVKVLEHRQAREEGQEGATCSGTQVTTEGEASTGRLVAELQKKLSASEVTISELSCDLESFKTALLERDEGYEERVQGYRWVGSSGRGYRWVCSSGCGMHCWNVNYIFS